MAKSISFKGNDLERAEAIEAGLHETKVQAQQNKLQAQQDKEELEKQNAELRAQNEALQQQQFPNAAPIMSTWMRCLNQPMEQLP